MTTNSIKLMAMAACIALSFVSCQNDNDNNEDRNLVFLTPMFQNATMIQTRSTISGDAEESVYESFSPEDGDQIQAFTYDARADETKYSKFRSGTFSYTNGEWKSTVGCEPNHSIDIYSIMPSTIAAAAMVSNGHIDLGGLKILSKKDVLYSVAAAKTREELSYGNFHLTQVKIASKQGDPEDKVWFAMNHMFAKANLKFKCDYNFRQLRTIEITKVTVLTEQGTSIGSYIDFPGPPHLGSTYNTEHLEIDMKLPPKDGASGMVELTPEPQDFDSFYFLPINKVPVSVKVNYNIYDYTGQVLTRGGQEVQADGIITIENPKPGNEYDITINVKPTYLYVLADVDGKMELTIE